MPPPPGQHNVLSINDSFKSYNEGVSNMKRIKHLLIVGIIAIVALSGTALFAEQTLEGYVVDVMCTQTPDGIAADGSDLNKDPGDHSVKCALMKPCIESGYGVFVSNGNGGWDFYTFDKRGSKKALKLIQNTSKEDHVMVRVSGDVMGDTIKVKSIDEI